MMIAKSFRGVILLTVTLKEILSYRPISTLRSPLCAQATSPGNFVDVHAHIQHDAFAGRVDEIATATRSVNGIILPTDDCTLNNRLKGGGRVRYC